MSSCELAEKWLKVPASLVKDSPGLGVDVGVSTAKVLYTPKAEWERLQKDTTARQGELRLLTCARNDLSDAISQVSKDGHLTANPDAQPTTVTTTGCGNPQIAAKINNQLHVNVSSEPENDCLIKGLRYMLQNYTYADLVIPHNAEIVAELEAEFAKQIAQFKEFQKFTSMKFDLNVDDLEVEAAAAVVEKADPMESTVPMAELLGDDIFPLTVLKCGSVFEVFTIKDASYTKGTSLVASCGEQSLMGMASLLCGTKTYSELVELAEKGNEFAVNTSTKAFAQEKIIDDNGEEEEEEEEVKDVYSKMMNTSENKERLCFGLGNAVGKKLGDFRSEDIAAAILVNIIRSAVLYLVQHAKVSSPRSILVIGDLMATAFVRDLFTKEWLPLAKSMVMMGKFAVPPEAYFMKQGGELGAVGALVHARN